MSDFKIGNTVLLEELPNEDIFEISKARDDNMVIIVSDRNNVFLYDSDNKKIVKTLDIPNISGTVHSYSIVKRINNEYYIYVLSVLSGQNDVAKIISIKIDNDFNFLTIVSTTAIQFTAGNESYEEDLTYDDNYIIFSTKYDAGNGDDINVYKFNINTEQINIINYSQLGGSGNNPQFLSDGSHAETYVMALSGENILAILNSESIYLYNYKEETFISKTPFSDIFGEFTEFTIKDIFRDENPFDSRKHISPKTKNIFMVSAIDNNIPDQQTPQEFILSFVIVNSSMIKLSVLRKSELDTIMQQTFNDDSLTDTYSLNYSDYMIQRLHNDTYFVLQFYFEYSRIVSGATEYMFHTVDYIVNFNDLHELFHLSSSNKVSNRYYDFDITNSCSDFYLEGKENLLTTFYHMDSNGNHSINLAIVPYNINIPNKCNKDNIINNVRNGWDVNAPIEYGTINELESAPDPLSCGTIIKTKIVKKENICTFMVQ